MRNGKLGQDRRATNIDAEEEPKAEEEEESNPPISVRIGNVCIEVGASQPKTKGKKKVEATTTINTEEEAEKIAKEIRKSHVKKKRKV